MKLIRISLGTPIRSQTPLERLTSLENELRELQAMTPEARLAKWGRDPLRHVEADIILARGAVHYYRVGW